MKRTRYLILFFGLLTAKERKKERKKKKKERKEKERRKKEKAFRMRSFLPYTQKDRK